jgi:hypothetical protein
MKFIHYSMLIGLLFTACTTTKMIQDDPSQEEWLSLFNGENLDDWQVKISHHELNDNFANTFRVANGVMQVNYDGYDSLREQFGHIFYKDPFSYYRLKLSYRFTGEQLAGGAGWALRNSGIMFHAQDPKTMLKDQDFPISLEYQFLGGTGTGERPTGNLCTPGTHVVINGELVTDHCITSKGKTYNGDQWVAVELLVLGDSLIRHIVEDSVVITYTNPVIGGGVVSNYDSLAFPEGVPLTSGYIALQSESHPVEFKNIVLLNLEGCMDPKARNYKSYYIKEDNSKCQY